MHTSPNVKMVNRFREVAGSWFCEPHEHNKWLYIQRELSDLRTIEPDHDWHIETTGEIGNWHRVEMVLDNSRQS